MPQFDGSISLQTDTVLVAVGGYTQVSATLVDAEGDTLVGALVTWHVSNRQKATIQADGRLFGVDTGTTHVTADYRGRSATATVLITRSEHFRLSGLRSPLNLGEHDTVFAVIRSAAGATLTDVPVQWLVSDSGVLTIDAQGILRGVGTGQAFVRLSGDHRVDSAAVTVEMQRWVTTPTPLVSLSVGWFHQCGLDAGGRAYCWGSNPEGQVGDGTRLPANSPVEVSGGRRYLAIGAGQENSCAVATDSISYCWGGNDFGELGQESRSPTRSLVPLMTKAPPFLTLDVGDHRSMCGIAAADSVVYCWAHNDAFQLGRAPRNSRDTLILPVSNSLQAIQISMGQAQGCALDVERHPWCWGSLLQATSTDSLPWLVDATRRYESIGSGDEAACGLLSGGAALCWGWGYLGQLGNGSTDAAFHRTPEPVAGGLTFVKLAGGFNYMCGITAEARLYCWGRNPLAELGNVKRGVTNVPVEIHPGMRFSAVASGHHSMCAVATDHRIFCW